ncbi:MAG: 50S ribosomal protein L9 [Gemmatimonadota bacterium]
MTDVILRRDVENLGEAGELVSVKPGYARNYLIPQGLALPATDGNCRRFEEEARQAARSATREKEMAEGLAGELEGRSLTFTVKAGEEGRLYGSVTAGDIADALLAEGVSVDRRLIQLDEPIKELGAYRVAVRLHAEVKPEIKVWVVAEE